MEVYIESVTSGADDKEGNIYEYWINGKLENGKSILILERWGNRGKRDIAQYVNKTIDCLIIVSEISDLRTEKLLKIDTITDGFYGKYLGEYNVPKYWEYKPISPDDAIETVDGVFLLYKNEVEDINSKYIHQNLIRPLKVGDIFSFYAEKLELLSWRLIED